MEHCTFVSKQEYVRGPDSDQYYNFTSTLELRKDYSCTVINRNLGRHGWWDFSG